PSTAQGTVKEILFQENDVVPVGTVIAKIETGGDGQRTETQAASSPAPSTTQANPPSTPPAAPTPAASQESVQAPSSGSGIRFYSPLVLNIAGKEGVSMAELESIPGTGNEGRVSKKDIIQYVDQRKSAP